MNLEIDTASHPNAVRLDALAIGESDDETRAHVATCAACAGYVQSLSQAASAFARDHAATAGAFMRTVRARAEITPLQPRRAKSATSRRTWVAGAATFFAAAACLVLVLRGGTNQPGGSVTPELEPVKGPTRLKGGVTVNVVVDRAGVQIRKTGPLELVAGDRVRIELALDKDAEIAAGVLGDDGEWAELQAPAFFPAGTHFSERSVFFQNDVPSGWLVAGAPDAIERARKTRDLAGVVAVRVQGHRP